MSMVIRANIPAINTHRNLGQSQSALSSSLSKLSSGYRINKGADGPADLVISEQLRSQMNGLSRAVRNTNEAINVLSIAEGALNEMNNILKKMKALAIHAASDGVTSPDQIEADQAELDSGIQTLQRIADTTKYSDQMLLNGNKDITYTVSTNIVGTQNNQMVDHGASTFEQIYKREGYSVTFGFNGATNVDRDTNIGDADFTKQAMKAYLEIDPTANGISQVDDEGKLTQGQSFILTGALGSRSFNFGKGTAITDIVKAIESYSGSTGVNASLTFNSDQAINQTGTVSQAAGIVDGEVGRTETRLTATTTVFDNTWVDTTGAAPVNKNFITNLAGAAGGLQYGLNTDGQGRIFVKHTGNGSYELYKDQSMSEASLVGVGTSGVAMVERNNSGLSGLTITLDDDAAYGTTAYLSLGNIRLNDAEGTGALDPQTVRANGVMAGNTAASTANNFIMTDSIASGVQLGVNTDKDGKIYTKVEFNAAGLATVYAYNDESMSNEYLVAMSERDLDLKNAGGVILNAIWNDEHTANTGLALHLNHGGFSDDNKDTRLTGSITFTNLGARISSTEYGSDQFIQIQQTEGGLFTYYDQKDRAGSATLVDAGGTGVTYRQYGQDATLNVNGKQMKTRGLELDMATTDVMAKIKFNAGKAGTTTIAQVGYTEGSVFTKNTALTFGDSDAFAAGTANAGFSGLLNNACHNTDESVGKFQGGMNMQLGESAGDQDRTVISLKSMAVSNLGRISHTGQFDKGKAVIETKILSLADVQGGQRADLATDATLSMKIIDAAINDVSSLRAQVGAVQSNMLQTNANNLEVAVEKITETESAIRNTDMASEMTAFTSSQVLQNAGINMLAQANASAQSVLSLLG